MQRTGDAVLARADGFFGRLGGRRGCGFLDGKNLDAILGGGGVAEADVADGRHITRYGFDDEFLILTGMKVPQ